VVLPICILAIREYPFDIVVKFRISHWNGISQVPLLTKNCSKSVTAGAGDGVAVVSFGAASVWFASLTRMSTNCIEPIWFVTTRYHVTR